MSAENIGPLYGAESNRGSMDFLALDAEGMFKALRSLMRYRRSRSSSFHSMDDAAMDIKMSRDYGHIPIVPAKLSSAGQEMLGPDWSIK